MPEFVPRFPSNIIKQPISIISLSRIKSRETTYFLFYSFFHFLTFISRSQQFYILVVNLFTFLFTLFFHVIIMHISTFLLTFLQFCSLILTIYLHSVKNRPSFFLIFQMSKLYIFRFWVKPIALSFLSNLLKTKI